MSAILYVLLLATGGSSLAAGLYSLPRRGVPRLNRRFLAVGCGVAVWTFGLALTAGAQTAPLRALGYRLAMLGWTAAAGAGYFFLLALTGEGARMKKRGALALYFGPLALLFLGFVVLPFFGVNTESIVPTEFGWEIRPAVSVWWLVSLAQAVVLAAGAAGVLLAWARDSGSDAVRAQARLLGGSLLAAWAFGVANRIVPLLTGRALPQLSGIAALLPIFAVSYLIHRYHFLREKNEDPDEEALDKAARTRIYDMLGALAAACAVFVSVFYSRTAPVPALLFSALLMADALVLAMLPVLRVDDFSRELAASLLFAFSVPAASLWLSAAGIVTGWAFLFLAMIAGLLFNRAIILATITASAVLSQLFLWAHRPAWTVSVTHAFYAPRLAILAVAALLAAYVHYIYVRRLRENVGHAEEQALLSEISHAFLSAGEENMDAKLTDALGQYGRFLRCDRACILLLDEGESARYAREWRADGISPGLGAFQDFLRHLPPSARRGLAGGKPVILKDTAFLPLPGWELRGPLAENGIRALVALPIRGRGGTLGLLGLSASRPLRRWNLGATDSLEVAAGIFAETILRVEAERKINFVAYHDQLTGLPNRLLFGDRLRRAIALARRSGKLLAVVFIDLDSFKAVNDTMGHDAGDLLLREVAKVLSGSVRGYDTVARFGGDEFILLLGQLSRPGDLPAILGKLIEALRKPVVLAGQEIFATASVGAAVYPQDGQDAETLIKNADAAMYHAKEEGKNRYALCSHGMQDEILGRMQLGNLLYRALERRQLALYYQPQVDLRSGRIVGSEALLRWFLPGRGLIMPADFIPLAEQTGLIQPIGAWVLETACRQNRRWQQLGLPGLRVAVNLSVFQLKNPRFIGQVKEILLRTGLDPKTLQLEITETVANGSVGNIVEILTGLKALGVAISIDDFGREYSSLSRLKLLPIDRIKMDMQFVQGIDKSEKDQAITKVIISLAKSLDLKVTAEGVETGPQLDFLEERMCDEVQGFYYYRPMPAEELEKVLLGTLPPGAPQAEATNGEDGKN